MIKFPLTRKTKLSLKLWIHVHCGCVLSLFVSLPLQPLCGRRACGRGTSYRNAPWDMGRGGGWIVGILCVAAVGDDRRDRDLAASKTNHSLNFTFCFVLESSFICPSIYHLSICLSICPFIYPSILSLCSYSICTVVEKPPLDEVQTLTSDHRGTQ